MNQMLPFFQALTPIVVFIIGILGTIIGFSLKQSIFKRLDGVNEGLQNVSEELTNLRVGLPEKYVLKNDCVERHQINSDSHMEIRKELRRHIEKGDDR